MKIKFFFLVTLIAINYISQAQTKEFKKVSVADLNEKFYSKDSSAAAVVLFRIGSVDYHFNSGIYTTTTVKTRIKIYKNEGLKQADQVISYYSGSNSSLLSLNNSYTYNLVDGAIEKTKLQAEGKFNERINKYWSKKKFTMPNVKVGSIIEFEYELRQEGVATPPKWDFQLRIPVAYSEYTTTVPEFFNFKKNQRGLIFPKLTEELVTNNVNFSSNKSVYILENAPAIVEEPFVSSLANYTSSISYELASVNIPPIYSGGHYQNFTNSWESITKRVFKATDFQDELVKTKYFEADVNNVIKGLTSNKDKVNAIFDYVKSKVKWNEVYAIGCDQGVKEAYEKGIGNSAEINLMLISMLRYADIATSPVLMSTRDNGIVFFPSLMNLNHVIAVVEADNQLLFLDATNPNSSPGLLPINDLNYSGRLMRKEGNVSYDVDLTPKTISRELNNLSVVIDEQGIIQGKLRKHYTDYLALKKRDELMNINQEEYLQSLENEFNSAEISEYNYENAKDLEKPAIQSFAFTAKNEVEIINDKMYLSPLLFLSKTKNPFQQETRTCPIDFGFPFEYKYNINIEIPEQYKVESTPAPVTLVTGDNVGTFKYLISTNENKIQAQLTLNVSSPILPEDYYEIIKDFYQKVIDKEAEKIVLTKI